MPPVGLRGCCGIYWGLSRRKVQDMTVGRRRPRRRGTDGHLRTTDVRFHGSQIAKGSRAEGCCARPPVLARLHSLCQQPLAQGPIKAFGLCCRHAVQLGKGQDQRARPIRSAGDCQKEKGRCWHEETAPARRVVRRRCGVTDGLPQERMAAATIPSTTMVPGDCSHAIVKNRNIRVAIRRRRTADDQFS